MKKLTTMIESISIIEMIIQGMMPIFTVILTRIIVGEKHTWKVKP
jgi:drug/metabolite transporter (DMT)-like permease